MFRREPQPPSENISSGSAEARAQADDIGRRMDDLAVKGRTSYMKTKQTRVTAERNSRNRLQQLSDALRHRREGD